MQYLGLKMACENNLKTNAEICLPIYYDEKNINSKTLEKIKHNGLVLSKHSRNII